MLKTIKNQASIQFGPCLKFESKSDPEIWRKMTGFLQKNRAKVKTYHFFAQKHPKMAKSYRENVKKGHFYALPIVKNTPFYTPFWPFTRKPIKLKPMGEGEFQKPICTPERVLEARFCIFEIFKISKNRQNPPPFLDVEI